jgi:hypothetical protein
VRENERRKENDAEMSGKATWSRMVVVVVVTAEGGGNFCLCCLSPFCFLNELHVFQESKLRVRARPVVCIPFCVDIKSFVASDLQRCQSIRFCVYEVI